MSKSNYIEKLKDPRWQRKRLEILQRDNFTCQKCFDNENTLNVHHRRYLINRDIWDYPDNLLVTLCEECHREELENRACADSDLIEILKELFYADDISYLTQGFMNMELKHSHEIVASAIAWAISNSDMQVSIIDNYFKHLDKKAKDKKRSSNGKV
jgi:hypothetical protein